MFQPFLKLNINYDIFINMIEAQTLYIRRLNNFNKNDDKLCMFSCNYKIPNDRLPVV